MFATIATFSTAAGDAPRLDTCDATLVSLVARYGDADAFDILYQRHAQAVTNAAGQVCRNHAVAEEIAQATFLALWERAGRLASKSVRVRPWLTTVARNAAIDHLRSGDRAVLSLDEVTREPAGALGPDVLALQHDAEDALRAAIATLAPEQREAVALVYFQGLTYRAVAEATGHPVGTIKSRVRLALEHLRARIVIAG